MGEWARCKACHVRLDYQVGSFVWISMRERGHLCIKCDSRCTVDALLSRFRERLRTALSAREKGDRDGV